MFVNMPKSHFIFFVLIFMHAYVEYHIGQLHQNT